MLILAKLKKLARPRVHRGLVTADRSYEVYYVLIGAYILITNNLKDIVRAPNIKRKKYEIKLSQIGNHWQQKKIPEIFGVPRSFRLTSLQFVLFPNLNREKCTSHLVRCLKMGEIFPLLLGAF